jgi:DNA-binding HxlR family transcriptional regulator
MPVRPGALWLGTVRPVSPQTGATQPRNWSMIVAMMRYGQFCPIAKAAEIVAERWTPLVVAEMLAGSTHFSDIRRGVPLMSQTLLSKRLKELERVGVIERRGISRTPAARSHRSFSTLASGASATRRTRSRKATSM